MSTRTNRSPQDARLATESAEQLEDRLIADKIPLSALGVAGRAALARQAEIVRMPAGAELSPAPGRRYYLLDGAVDLTHGEAVLQLSPDSELAQAGLPQLTPANVVAREDSRLLSVDAAWLSTLLLWFQSGAETERAGEHDGSDAMGWLTVLVRSELFSSIPPANWFRVFEVMERVTAAAGEVIVRQGEPGNHYYVVRRGRCAVSREPAPGQEPYQLAELGPGDSFGEEALVEDSQRNATVTMREDGELWRLTKQDFIALFVEPRLSEIDRAQAEDLVRAGARWLDVRLATEHRVDGLAESINISLAELRDHHRLLDRTHAYVVYCDNGRRASAAAAMLQGWGLDVRVLAGGLAGGVASFAGVETARGQAATDGEQRLKQELAKADAELEQALRLKVEATAARRLFADQAEKEQTVESRTEQEKARLRGKLKRLELESLAAGQALSQSQRKKLEIEAAVRTEAANAEKRRAEAEAACERLRKSAEEKLQSERKKLAEEYQRREAELGNLVTARSRAEAEFQRSREEMERQYAERIERIEREAAALRAELEETKRAGDQLAGKIRGEHDAAAASLREETETRLRSERERLEAEFAGAVKQIEAAKQRIDEIEGQRRVADGEARDFALKLHEAAQERQRQVQALWAARRAELDASLAAARRRAETARETRRRAESEKQTLYEELARLRGTTASDQPASGGEAALSDSLAAQQARVEAASGELQAAERAQRAAESAREVAVVKEAEETAAEKELRMRLYTEAEAWLQAENQRSEQDLAAAREQVEHMRKGQRDAAERRAQEAREALSMISDIRTQLESADDIDPLSRALGNQAFAEHRASSTHNAQERLAAERDAAKAALERARAHIARLRENQARGASAQRGEPGSAKDADDGDHPRGRDPER